MKEKEAGVCGHKCFARGWNPPDNLHFVYMDFSHQIYTMSTNPSVMVYRESLPPEKNLAVQVAGRTKRKIDMATMTIIPTVVNFCPQRYIYPTTNPNLNLP